jgi:hypothetical protein
MTLYEFNRLNEEEQLKTVWSIGVFLDNYISKTETLNCYAINMFFVELVYDKDKNKVIEVRSFKSGHRLDKYSPNFKTEY